MKTIIFSHQESPGEHNCRIEEFEFDDSATDKEIESVFVDWVWEQIGDNFGWCEKKQGESC